MREGGPMTAILLAGFQNPEQPPERSLDVKTQKGFIFQNTRLDLVLEWLGLAYELRLLVDANEFARRGRKDVMHAPITVEGKPGERLADVIDRIVRQLDGEHRYLTPRFIELVPATAKNKK